MDINKFITHINNYVTAVISIQQEGTALDKYLLMKTSEYTNHPVAIHHNQLPEIKQPKVCKNFRSEIKNLSGQLKDKKKEIRLMSEKLDNSE